MEGKSAVANLLVAPASVASIQLSESALQLQVGAQAQITATTLDPAGNGLQDRLITWRSSNASVATVDSTGRVTAIGTGSAAVTASSEGRIATIAVSVIAVPAASVTITPGGVELVEGQTTQLAATVLDAAGASLSGRTVFWSSNNPAVAVVSSVGVVTGVSSGTASVSATSEGQAASITANVRARPASVVVVSPGALSMIVGQNTRLTVQVTDASGTVLADRAVQFRSGNSNIATVTADGAVTAVAAGVTSIVVTSEGLNTTVSVTVSPVAVASVSVTPQESLIIVGESVTLTAVPRDAAGQPLTGRTIAWSSGAPGIASVTANGVVTALGAGSAVILASSDGRVGSASVTVRARPVGTVTVSPTGISVPVAQTSDLTATVRDGAGAVLTERAVLWSSSNAAVATVSSTGRVTGIAAGSATITASAEGKSGSATVSVTVSPVAVASVSVTPQESSIIVGESVTLTAVPRDAAGQPLTGRTIAWSSGAPGIASVTANGVVTAFGVGSAVILASSDGRVGSAIVAVRARPVGTVTVSPTGISVPVAQTGDLTATVRDGTGALLTDRVVVWSSSNAAVANVSSTGRITGIAAGSATITASAEGKSGSAAVTVTAPVVPDTVGRVTVSPSNVDLFFNGPTNRQVQLTVRIFSTTDKELFTVPIIWSSNRSSVATVSLTGLVIAVSAGDAIVTASAGGRSGTAVIRVERR